MSDVFQKTTLVPLHHCGWDLNLSYPINVLSGVTFEKVEGLLKASDFDLWRTYLSEAHREQIARLRYGLVHRFISTGHIGKEEQDSSDLMFRIFLCLRLLKPTKEDFSSIQFKNGKERPVDVFSFTRLSEVPLNIPEAEAFNEVTVNDIARLGLYVKNFVYHVDKGPMHFRRALRSCQLAYDEIRDPVTQIVIWTMGIQQFYSEGDEALETTSLIRKIETYIGAERDLYGDSNIRTVSPGLEPFSISRALPDLFKLRNRFVHGQWTPSEWLKPVRPSFLPNGGTYADVLRETAAFVLRKSLLRFVELNPRPASK